MSCLSKLYDITGLANNIVFYLQFGDKISQFLPFEHYENNKHLWMHYFFAGCTPWCHTGWFSDGHAKRAQNHQCRRSCQFWELHCQVWATRLNHTTSTKTELPSATFSSSSWTLYWHETGISYTRKYTCFWFWVMVTLLYFFPFCLSVTSLYPKLGKNDMACLAPTITTACHAQHSQISIHLHTKRGNVTVNIQ